MEALMCGYDYIDDDPLQYAYDIAYWLVPQAWSTASGQQSEFWQHMFLEVIRIASGEPQGTWL